MAVVTATVFCVTVDHVTRTVGTDHGHWLAVNGAGYPANFMGLGLTLAGSEHLTRKPS